MRAFSKPILILGMILTCFLLLSACGKEKTIPQIFLLENDHLPTLSVIGKEHAGKLVETNIPKELKPALDHRGEELPSTEPITYSYTQLEDSGDAVRRYVEILSGTEYGFGIVNAAGQSVPPPDYTQEEGFVVLSRANVLSKKMLRFTMIWEPGSCTINLYQVDGLPARTDPSEPKREISPSGEIIYEDPAIPKTNANSTPTMNSSAPMDAGDIVYFFERLSPSTLGLDGSNMEAYTVYYLEGKVTVNEERCSRVRIYSISYPEESNYFLGTFLISEQSGRLYKHDIDNDIMIELNS